MVKKGKKPSIYKKAMPPFNDRRYQQEFEFMFVFVKGKLKTFNSLMVPKIYNDKRKNGTVDYI